MRGFKNFFDKLAIVLGAFIIEFFLVLILRIIFDTEFPSNEMWSGYLLTFLWLITFIWEIFLTDSKFVQKLRLNALNKKAKKILNQNKKDIIN